MNINTVLLMRAIAWLVVAGGALVLAQLWLTLFSDVVFWKLFATLVVLGVVASVVLAIRADLKQEKEMKDDGYVD